MNRDRQQNLQDLLVFALLIAIGVAGRWGQPEWCFTPMAATAIFAGLYFSRVAIAVMVPIAILAISDLLLPAYNSIPVMIATYAVMIVPVWLGPVAARRNRGWSAASRWALFGALAGDAVLSRIELRRLGVSERLREITRRPGQMLLGRRAVLSLDARRRRVLSDRACSAAWPSQVRRIRGG